jgi:hypothetical protein
MNEIKCPHCGKVFQADESGLAQIRNEVFKKEFAERLAEQEKNWANNQEKSLEIAKAETEKSLQIEMTKLSMELQKADLVMQSKLKEKESDLQIEMERKEAVIKELKEQMKSAETQKTLDIKQTVEAVEKERDKLKNALDNKNVEQQLAEKNLKEKYDMQLQVVKEELDRYKDLKAKQSTKMVGETLEKHCEIEFEQKLRPNLIDKHIEFGKDNDIADGTKGDYIYRELDQNEDETLSIMFEMKDESAETATKKKNDDFLKKLNDDRDKKKCEYAVLVSLLESDNEVYNGGIVNKSYIYPKMYVIRPQFFVPIISLLRDMASKSATYKSELAVIRNQNIDIIHFEENVNAFKDDLAKSLGLAGKKHTEAVELLEKQKSNIQKIIDLLTGSDKNLQQTNNKLSDLSVKKLTYNSPTMAEKFAELKGAK